ncbi:hypothetical protein ACJ6WE_01040 [Streptomyces sp. MMS24-I31]|uniref:hypothetical protein n=1 Tax=Streptomyces sp. MMS24-I31 TaxID=3351563 RepID=UPI003896A089
MTQPEDRPVAQTGHSTGPDPLRVRNQKEFRDALAQLRADRGIKSLKQLEQASEDGTGRRLAPATVSTVLNKDALPERDFVIVYLSACGLHDTEQEPWLLAWAAVRHGTAPVEEGVPENANPDDESPPTPPAGAGGTWRRLPGERRKWMRAAIAGTAIAALAAGVGAWQLHQQRVHDRQVQDQERYRKRHCGTSNPSLVTGADGQCTGITDGSDGSSVFGSDLKPVLTAIGAENRNVIRGDDYVTLAFLTPLASRDANSLTVGQYVAELEGAYTAVEEENDSNSRPKVRFVVANMGSSEKQWTQAVDRLTALKAEDHLVAVAGMGLSQQESVDAARALSKADLPMVGDLITADGFDATGAVDGRGPISGLARVALTNTDQLTAISKELGSAQRTAALVRTSVTPNGTKDLYTESLNRGFHTVEGLKKHLDDTSDFAFDPRGGPGAILPTISQNICNTGRTIDTVYYAARVKYLPDFLNALASRSCHSQPITVITGSDAAALDPRTPALHTSDAPITLLYASFPTAAQLHSSDNPDHALYDAFTKDFASPHHGRQFPPEHLTSSYWAIVAHDAVLTFATALHNAAANGDGPPSLPNRYAVRNELYALRNGAVPGASGHFGIDNNGNRTNTTTVTTVHHLGQPLPNPTHQPG